MVRKALLSEKFTSVPNFLSITSHYNFMENIFQTPGGKKLPVMSSAILYLLQGLLKLLVVLAYSRLWDRRRVRIKRYI